MKQARWTTPLGVWGLLTATAAGATVPVEFSRDLLPVLRRNCLACHNATKAKADLNLETPALIRKGGESGPAVVPGKSTDSLAYQAAAHKVEAVMPPRNNKVNAADLTPDELSLLGRWIDEGAADGASASTAAPVPVFRASADRPSAVTALAFSPAGRALAAARGGRVDLYDAATGAPLARLVDPTSGPTQTADPDAVHAIAFSRDGLIATGGFRVVKLWRGEPEELDPAIRAALEVEAASGLQALCAQRLQTATERAKADQAAAAAAATAVAQAHTRWLQNPADGAVAKRLSDARTNLDVTTRLAGEAATLVSTAQTSAAVAEARVREARTAKDAGSVEAAPFCGPPRPWQLVRTLGKIEDPSVFADRVTALGFSPDGLRLATGGGIPSRQGEIRIWDTSGGALVATVKNPPADTINALQFSPDGMWLATAGADRSLRTWNALDGSPAASFDGHSGAVLSVAWRADGEFLASAAADKTLRLWEVAAKKQVRSIATFGREVSVAAFVGGGDTLLAASGDASVRVGDHPLPDSAGFVLCGAADPTARFAAAGSHDGIIRLWSLKDRKLVVRIGPEE